MNYKNKNILVTGGSGFLGKSLVKRLLDDGNTVRVVARDEGALITLKQDFPEIEIHTGDIKNRHVVEQAVKGMHGVFHLAAFKHVGLAEKFVEECVDSNVMGTINILKASVDHSFEFVVGISTDKAAQVAGVYGATKLLMERLFKQYDETYTNCSYRIVRYGNVLYSTGSVLCKWKRLLQEGKTCVLTEPEATRFYWTVDQAIDLIYECMDKAEDSTPFCPQMKAVKILDLFEAMKLKYGDETSSYEVIGLQPGENLHEKVLDDGPYSNEVGLYNSDEILGMV